MKDKIPIGWKEVSLDTFLTPEQIEQILPILNSNDDMSSKARQLKTIFSLLREQLKAKGVVPEYLAYALAYESSVAKLPPLT